MPDSRIVLSGVSPLLAGLQWEAEKVLRIGRTPNMEVMLDDRSVSRRHAEILFGPEGWAIADLGSSNGTYVNGVRIGRTFQKLRRHDLVQVGDLRVAVKVLEEKPTAPANPNSHIRTSGSFMRLQAVAQNSWQQAVKTLGEAAEQRGDADKGFLTLLRAGHHLSQVSGLNDLLHSVLGEVATGLDVQRGTIVLLDEASGELQPRAVVTPKGDVPGRSFSKTLATRCFRDGESVLCTDTRMDDECGSTSTLVRGMMSSVICALLRTPRKKLGVLHLDRGPMQPPFSKADLCLADAIAANVSTGIECARLVEQQREQSIQIVTALAQAVELRDKYTAGHTQRVTNYSMLLARELDFSLEDQKYLQTGTPLHDLGKVAIRDDVLLKPGKLTPDEFEHIKLHPIKGAQILETMSDFSNLIPIVRSHHEHWDGTGYPDRLSAAHISHLARVVAVTDAFDAMTSPRPYRPALSTDEAFAQLCNGACTQFDPYFIEVFVRLRPRLEAMLHHEESQQNEILSLTETIPPQLLHEELQAVP
jgi:putative nucleotidyltransferase with HDIG domain